MNPDIARRRHARAAQAASSQHNGHGGQQKLNVGETERYISIAGGAILAAYGLARGSLSGLLLGCIGAGFIYRGVTGHCQVYEALGQNTADESAQQSGGREPATQQLSHQAG
jgi:uncharacterized membrane protein